ncbi:hypothetical protein XO10_06350 [Marinitoga sp. 1135]|uniref:Major Facilitator Superfamily transporter n=1 Tax=Marinitoga piezophila (strain DSM 14283 / JCM 11233 / KA3) TaxID=443254 RepID=H2J302_MARPK|nr:MULTISPECIES: MFS transporter [Marinitoga]AEX85693.1 Major Facilitator Superfamily transporter [Marinitoga piezophila KA3]APT76145.1 hypothetical protein LN42_06935 [Marinitoga sp. 1137]NUU95898.1 hypothetical protein [Marinitoga sp. 1135]NUU97809.1 hypothetical protein [Marinitoga sp. 1138]
MKGYLKYILALPFLQVFVQVGIASSFPQLTEMFGSAWLASTFIGITPLVSIVFGSFWGKILEKHGESKTFLFSMVIWSVSLYLSGLSLSYPILAIVFRGFQGIADSALFANALTVITKGDFSKQEKAKYFGMVEFLASFGAVMGPLVIGSGFIYIPKHTLTALGVLLFIFTLIIYKQLPVIEIHSEYSKKQVAKFSPRIFLAAFFGIITIAIVVGFQVTMPLFVEGIVDNPLYGKIYTSIFALLLMLGNLFKHKVHGVKLWIPLGTFATLSIAMFVNSFSLVGFLIFVLVSGIFLGLSITMSSEYASILSVGFEEKGMAVFSAFRLSGNFFGPYLSIFFSMGGINMFTMVLAVLALASSVFLINFKNFQEVENI